ncbi:uncharacterized protein LOC127707897 [Mytilus californianus]|uniref:uncharacterized protein LOC127707897 n=1 Tax=Mytilus californianus TaxID=6549 RepID=UPI00224800D4|nr:uncharacterized protein LOC127707897 [Mytilus californianus]
MSLYKKSENVNLESVLTKILRASEHSLLDKILRHLVLWCSFEQYMSVWRVLLDAVVTESDIYEKLVDSCKQKCTQYLTKTAKISDLKEFLRHYQLLLPLPVVCCGLHQTVEKNILEFLSHDSKLTTFDCRAEFLHMILEGNFFDTTEGKEDLLKQLVGCKRGLLRSCVINLLQDQSFQYLPDDCLSKILVKYMQNSLQFNRKKISLIESVIKAYEDLYSVLQLPVVKRNEAIGVQIDQIVLKAVAENNIKDVLKAVGEIEKTEHLHKIFQGHLRSILHDKHSQKLPSTVIREICGTEHLRVNSRLTANIITIIVDLLGICDEYDLKEVFLKALDHATFWKEIFTAEGNPVIRDALLTYEPCMMVARSIDNFKNLLKGRHLGSCLIKRLKKKENDMLTLLTCRLDSKRDETKQKLQGQWMICCTTVDEHLTNIQLIHETFKILRSGLTMEIMPSVISNTMVFLQSQQEQVKQDELSVADILQENEFEEYIRELSESCNLLLKIIKSQVFWNILQEECGRKTIKVSADDKEDTKGNVLNGITLSVLFGGEVELDMTKSFRITDAIAFIQSINNICLERYKQLWTPYLRSENRPLDEFKRMFSKVTSAKDMEQEIKIAEEFCRIRSAMKLKNTLLKFAELKNYSKTVEAVTNCTNTFEFKENVQTYTNVVKSFNKLFKAKKSEDLKDMFMDEMEGVLDSVENLCQYISPEVTEVLEVLKSAVSLLNFLNEVVDEDIRNLIDAVEEHSEQYVRESTVSDLIEVKRFLYPILKKTYEGDLTNFFSLLRKQLTSGAKNIPAKIHDCRDNLHTLRSLYKNVANRGERTKEIIDSIIKRGKFCFCLKDHICDITVKYKQGRKPVSHNSAGLSDLRSRALLLMNAEDRDRSRQKTNRKRENLERFLLVVDIAFNISSMCLQLKQAGHFDYMCYEDSCDQHKLHDLSMQLTHEYDEWTKSLNFCRGKYYYMNFMHPAQLQQLFDYLHRNHENEEMILTSLQFINRSFNNIESLKTEFTSLSSKSSNDGILQNIAITLQSVFGGYHTPDKPLATYVKEPKITDIVHVGIPYIVALEEESPLVIRTMFALFMNTTNQLPDASQILFCREETTIDEIILFLKRCTDIPSTQDQRILFCIINIEMLTNDIQNQFVDILLHLQSGNFLLSVICRGHIHHPFLDQFSDRLSRPTPMTESSLKECLRRNWPNVYVISSDVPGLGKTEMVHSMARDKGLSVATLHVSGKVDSQAIVRNLHLLKLKQYSVLHIDIGITPSPSELDSVLFQLIILGHISVGSDAYTLSTDHVFIEISNTVGKTLCNSLPTTTCLKRINLDWNNYYDLKVCMERNSPIQVVCQYLKALDTGRLDRTDIYLTGSNTPKSLKADECRILLEKYFSSAGDMSYTLLHIFLNVLADQLKKLSSSVFFRTSNIAVMIGENNLPSVKSNLVKVLVESCQEFACRSVQSCRLSQAASLHTSSESYRDNSSTYELAQRVAGMIRWEDSNHLMILFHQNVQTVSAIYRDIAKVPKNIKCLFESQMKKPIDDFKCKTQTELQDILQMLTRSKANKLSDKTLDTLAADYALTPDNLLKMILISLRINAMIPVVIMGETGCGKTSLVRYLAEISDVDFELFSIHAGIDAKCILQKIKEVNRKALSCLHSSTWLFLDEINTCDHLGLINSVICHRYIQNEDLAPNLTILAACNPYRMRKHSTIFTSGLQGKVKTDELSRLAYRVHPLPEALIDYVWDYGSLNEKDEQFYISKMVNRVFDVNFNSIVFEPLLTNILAMSQSFVRAKEATDSCVSLRDVDRCKKLVQWFLQFLQKKRTATGVAYGIETKAIVLALAVCYHSRFENVEVRKAYREKISHIISKEHYPISSEGVLKIIRDEQKNILDRMTLPNGIAKNTALQENVFVVLVCILNKIPIFLVGKPGCSKSLSIQLIRSNLRGKDSKDILFQNMPQLFCVSFQGSESSTSDGIIKVFEKAEKYQQHNEKDVISVVILDEIGLAEISRFNPLKVLHGLLEPGNKQNPNVSVVGISNWALDAAKMNRAIHLSRPDMDLDELKYTGHAISSAMLEEMKSETVWETDDSHENRDISDILEMSFDEIAIAYYKYTADRQRFANFHGLRDYYSLIKYVCRCRQLSSRFDKSETDIILKGIARNFGGLPTEMMEIVGIFQESVPNLKQKPIPVTDLIKENLDDNVCRHLMLLTNGDAVISVLESHLNDATRPFEIIFGSHFEDDLSDDYNYRILSRIILCMEQGLVLILKGLESIYGSLYDMLNQNYTIVGNKKNCRIALGHYSNPMCHVHDAFKCIVLVEETKLDYSDPPFLNRFEKQQFRFSDLIYSDDFGDIISEIEEMLMELCHVEGCMFTPENTIPSYNHDLLVSLILFLRNTEKSEILNQKHFFEMAISLILWMIPPEVMVRAMESKLYYKSSGRVENLLEMYMELPIHQGLSQCLDLLLISRSSDNDGNNELTTSSTNGEMLLFYTYMNIHCNIRSLFSEDSHQIERLSSFKSEKHLSGKIEDFFNSEKSVLLLQCSAALDGQHLLLSKVIVENIRRKCQLKQKHVCMIIHLDRNVANDQQLVPINFLSGWKIIFIDGLEKPATTIGRFICTSKYDIVKERRPLNEYIVDNLFWAFTRIRFTSENNTIENQRFIIDKLRLSEAAISTIEELILNWIEEQSSNDHYQWCIDVAKNSHELYKSGALVQACENSIHDVIKSPLAMYLYRLLELQILSQVFVVDEFSIERTNSWREIVLSKSYTSIEKLPPVTGPECYSCSVTFLPLKMPLSALIMNKIDLRKDEFIDIIRKIRIQNDIEPYEDIPFELFEKTVSGCTDLICHDVDDIYNVVYDGRIDDYVHDFCCVNSSGIANIKDKHKTMNIFYWALKHFIQPLTFQQEDIVQVIATIHAAFWLNSSTVSSICQLVALSEQVIKISWKEAAVETDFEEEGMHFGSETLYISNLSRPAFVDSLCLKLLPTAKVIHSYSLLAWLEITQVILPIAKEVTDESTIMPALQLCQEIIHLVLKVDNFKPKSVFLLGELFLENEGQIDSPSVFNLILSILQQLQVESSADVSKLQQLFCSYVMRSLLSNPSDNEILKLMLTNIARGATFDSRLAYFGKCLEFALYVDKSGNEHLLEEIILNQLSEVPPFVECFDSFMKTVDLLNEESDVLPCLLIDVVQKSFSEDSLNTAILFQIESASHNSIRCFLQACDVLNSKTMSFRYITAVAFLKQFFQTYYVALEQCKLDTSEMPIVSHHINTVVSTIWKASTEELPNPLLVYLMKYFANRHGIELIHRSCKPVQNTLTTLQSINWNINYIESSVVLNPLAAHIDLELANKLLQQINSVLEKENKLQDLLEDERTVVTALLGTLSKRFYMQKCVRELTDEEHRMATAICRIVDESKLPQSCKHISQYLLGNDFDNELFSLSVASESPYPHLVSIVLHLCCLLSVETNMQSIWFINLFKPDKTTLEDLPFIYSQNMLNADQKILLLLSYSTIVGSVGFRFTSDETLRKFSQSRQQDMIKQFVELQHLLQLDSSNLCILMHVVILKCNAVIFCENKSLTTKEKNNIRSKCIDIIKHLVANRWQVIRDFKISQYAISQKTPCIEAYIEEIIEPTESVCIDKVIFRLFRMLHPPTKDIFINELCCGETQQFAFLHLVFKSTGRLIVPQFLPALLRWHMSVITYASYKFRKVDFRDLSVQKFFSQEIDDSRRDILKKYFEQFKKAWNEIKDNYCDVMANTVTSRMQQMNTTVKMEYCTVWNDESSLLLLLQELVQIHNTFLDQSNDILGHKQRHKKFKLIQQVVALLDVKSNEIVTFRWNDNWLKFCQSDTRYGLGQRLLFDYEKIEEEVKKDILMGKMKIEFPTRFPKPVFTDDLYQNSVELLSDLEKSIPQHQLTNEIRKSVDVKVDRDAAFVTDLLTQLGMVLALLKKTGGDNSQPLIEYLEKWQSVTGMNSNIFKRILPEPVDSVKLGHVVTLYKWLEELNGRSLVEALDERFHKTLHPEAKEILHQTKNVHMAHLEKLQHPLLVFVHRCLALRNAISHDHPLVEYISSQELWWKEHIRMQEGNIGVIAGADNKCIPISEILSPLILIENICETVLFVQEAIKEVTEFNVRISNISNDYQKTKTVQTNTRKSAAKRFLKM